MREPPALRRRRARLRFRVRAPAPAQALALTARVDPGGTIRERDEANNSASATVQVAPLPDLVAASLTGPDSLSGVGTPATYRLTVRNQGGATAAPTTVQLIVDSRPLLLRAVTLEGERHGLNGVIAGRTVVCQNGTLPAGQEVTIRVDVLTGAHVGLASGRLRASASAAQPDRNAADNALDKPVTVN